MSTRITLEKLDKRHNLHEFFTHRTWQTDKDQVPEWVKMRNWLWENYGPGLEYETVWITQYHPEFKIQWAWRVEDQVYYLYLKDEILTHFSLKFLNT